MATLKAQGVSPAAYVWVHAQNAADLATRGWAAQEGAFVELDGVGPGRLEAHVQGIVDLHRRNRLDRVLVSQDAGWYHVGEPGGGRYRPHTFLFEELLPALRARGLTDADVKALLEENPARAFAVRRRPLAR
jgi:phosphotriesterase-related protein